MEVLYSHAHYLYNSTSSTNMGSLFYRSGPFGFQISVLLYHMIVLVFIIVLLWRIKQQPDSVQCTRDTVIRAKGVKLTAFHTAVIMIIQQSNKSRTNIVGTVGSADDPDIHTVHIIVLIVASRFKFSNFQK